MALKKVPRIGMYDCRSPNRVVPRTFESVQGPRGLMKEDIASARCVRHKMVGHNFKTTQPSFQHKRRPCLLPATFSLSILGEVFNNF